MKDHQVARLIPCPSCGAAAAEPCSTWAGPTLWACADRLEQIRTPRRALVIDRRVEWREAVAS